MHSLLPLSIKTVSAFFFAISIWKGSIAFGLTGELPTPILRVSIPSFSRVATLLGKFHVVVTVAVLVPTNFRKR